MSYPEEVRSEADRGVYGDHEEQADDVYEAKKNIMRHTKRGNNRKYNTYSAALVSAQAIAKDQNKSLGWRSKTRAEGGRTLVYHWRCLLMSQKEATVAMMVKKPVIIHPTSCAIIFPYRHTISPASRTRGQTDNPLHIP